MKILTQYWLQWYFKLWLRKDLSMCLTLFKSVVLLNSVRLNDIILSLWTLKALAGNHNWNSGKWQCQKSHEISLPESWAPWTSHTSGVVEHCCHHSSCYPKEQTGSPFATCCLLNTGNKKKEIPSDQISHNELTTDWHWTIHCFVDIERVTGVSK